MIRKLFEGGNVFKDEQGVPVTQRINKDDVPATIAYLEKILGIQIPKENWLGSTGRAPTSGDLDIAIDVNKKSKDNIANALIKFVQSKKQDPNDFVVKKGEVHFKTPIRGDANNGYVQTDFMFLPNIDWGTFYYAGGEDSVYKGMFRNVLMSSIAKSLGLKVGLNGVFSRTTNDLVSIDPDWAAEALLGPGHDRKSLKNVETIYSVLEKDPDKAKKLEDFRGYLERAGVEEPKNVNESESGFLARLRDRIVNQGMQPIIEDTTEVYTEYLPEEVAAKKRDPRTPHPEDFIFQGSAAALQALQGLDYSVQNPNATTIKWDGKPALIFGRDPRDGKLAVMDKYMFDNGVLAKSPEDWKKYDANKASGNLRTDLYPKLAEIWPGLDAATQSSGFYWGDLMYAGSPQQSNNNYVMQPNLVTYTIPKNSQIGKTMDNSTGGIVIHQKFDKLGGDPKPWDGKGLQSVPGGVTIFKPNLGLSFSLQKPKSAPLAAKAVQQYGKYVDELLNAIPQSTRARIQTYFNQRVIGRTPLSLPEWLKGNVSAKQYNSLVVGNPDEQGNYNKQTGNVPGLLYTLDSANKMVPSPAYAGLEHIWKAIYNYKLSLAQQLERQVKGLEQSSQGTPEGEGFVVGTPSGLIKLVNRGVFSAANAAKN